MVNWRKPTNDGRILAYIADGEHTAHVRTDADGWKIGVLSIRIPITIANSSEGEAILAPLHVFVVRGVVAIQIVQIGGQITRLCACDQNTQYRASALPGYLLQQLQ